MSGDAAKSILFKGREASLLTKPQTPKITSSDYFLLPITVWACLHLLAIMQCQTRRNHEIEKRVPSLTCQRMRRQVIMATMQLSCHTSDFCRITLGRLADGGG